jgi:hypothetical protein
MLLLRCVDLIFDKQLYLSLKSAKHAKSNNIHGVDRFLIWEFCCISQFRPHPTKRTPGAVLNGLNLPHRSLGPGCGLKSKCGAREEEIAHVSAGPTLRDFDPGISSIDIVVHVDPAASARSELASPFGMVVTYYVDLDRLHLLYYCRRELEACLACFPMQEVNWCTLKCRD